MAASVAIDCRASDAVARRAAEILKRTIEERCGIRAASGGKADCRIVLSIESGIGAEGFAMRQGSGAVHIVGNDGRGVVYGVGKFLRGSRYAAGDFTPSPWQGTSVPAKPVRGMYFASHFHNFYHDAPVEAVERYVEELALWGCNALSVWFDMHHFNGIEDPEAQAMIRRLRAILAAGKRVGIGPGLTTLANEAYATSPAELHADWTAGHDGYTSPPGGHYHVEVCPHKPGGLDYILKVRREMLEAFADLGTEYVWLWPYDQGGCTCARCAPWGANGFLVAAEAEAGVIRECCPSAKTIVSTWYFDHFTSGEWEGIDKAFGRERPGWADYLMADDYGGFPEYPLKHGVPGGLSVLNFPELSMEGMFPWGGFGANPRPGHWQAQWDRTRQLVAGGFPYSEGIYEDVNKVMMFQLGWDPDRKTDDIVREYASYEFSPVVAEDIVRAARLMEEGQAHWLKQDFAGQVGKAACVHGAVPAADLYSLTKAGDAQRCFDIVRGAEAKLPAYARSAWRWRIVWLRAALDGELHRSGGKATAHSEEYFDELNAIYHADHAELQVLAPSVKALKRVLAEGMKQT